MLRIFLNIVVLHSYLVLTPNAMVQEKVEAVMPYPRLSPPEGNTTFLEGTTWCVARPGVSPTDLQIALDWACGLGGADCRPIRDGGPCFQPNTLLSHASFAFNSYYQQNGNNEIACHFGGTASLTRNDPSFDRCVFAASGPTRSSATLPAKTNWWKIDAMFIMLIFYLGRR